MVKKRYGIYYRLDHNIKLMPGFSRIWNLVKKQDWKKGLATSATQEHVNRLFKMHKMNLDFDAVVTAENVKKGKPDPETYFKAASQLRVEPKDCLVLEDSPKGLLSAKRAGMKCIAVPDKKAKRKQFKRADAIVKSLADINLKLINSL